LKLSELSGAHLGSRVTIETPNASISGVLFSLRANADMIMDGIPGRPTEYAVGRMSIAVKVGKFEADNLSGEFDCEVHGK
jgi:hypothetical protein